MRKLLCLLKSCFIVFAAVVCVVAVSFGGWWQGEIVMLCFGCIDMNYRHPKADKYLSIYACLSFDLYCSM